MTCRGLRGATTATGNTPAEILDATRELLDALAVANRLRPEEIGSVVFTATQDLDAAFPAQAARALGWTSVPLLDAVEIAVPGALPRCIRVLVHWNTDRPAEALRHVYLRAAAGLRPEWAGGGGVEEWRGRGAEGQAMAPLGAERTRRGARETATREDGQGGGKVEEKEVSNRPQNGAGEDDRMSLQSVSASAVSAPVGGADGTPVVAYQGEPGAYSQEAIYQHFGRGAGTLACTTFEDIFAAVDTGRADYGLLPIENSQAGSVHQAYDLLLDHDLQVVGEVKLRVRHCLLVPPGASAADIRQVRSHPQALAQVQRYLKRRGWQAVPAYDTAGAARELAASKETGSAAIASALAGQIYGLEAVEHGIEDDPDNTTRFFVLTRVEEQGGTGPSTGSPAARDLGTAGEQGSFDKLRNREGAEDGPEEKAQAGPARKYKTSLVFATTHTPGALYRALGEFAGRGLNLTKIESRPRHNRPWHYVFYLDFEGGWHDPAVEQALVGLLARAAFVKLLGSYPAAE